MWGQTSLLRMFGSEFGGAGLVADPGRAAAAGRDALGPAGARRTDARSPAQLDDLGRLAARHRTHVQLHVRDHPPVLHSRPRAGDRRIGRHRRRRAVGAPRRPRRRLDARRGDRRRTTWWAFGAARPHTDLAPVAARRRGDHGIAAALAIAAAPYLGRAYALRPSRRRPARHRGSAGPAAYSIATAATPHSGVAADRRPGRGRPAGSDPAGASRAVRAGIGGRCWRAGLDRRSAS